MVTGTPPGLSPRLTDAVSRDGVLPERTGSPDGASAQAASRVAPASVVSSTRCNVSSGAGG